MSGKGDTRRPSAVPASVVALNWERIFRPNHRPIVMIRHKPIPPDELPHIAQSVMRHAKTVKW